MTHSFYEILFIYSGTGIRTSEVDGRCNIKQTQDERAGRQPSVQVDQYPG